MHRTPTAPVCLPGYDRFFVPFSTPIHGNRVTTFTPHILFCDFYHILSLNAVSGDDFRTSVCVKLISGKFAPVVSAAMRSDGVNQDINIVRVHFMVPLKQHNIRGKVIYPLIPSLH